MKDIKDKNVWQTFIDIPNRIFSLIWNMISRWGLYLTITAYLIYSEKFVSPVYAWVWIGAGVLYLFKTEVPDIINKVADSVAKMRGKNE